MFRIINCKYENYFVIIKFFVLIYHAHAHAQAHAVVGAEDWSRVRHDPSMDEERISPSLDLYDCLRDALQKLYKNFLGLRFSNILVSDFY